MSAEVKKEIELELGHVLFIDIVGYSKLLISEQRRSLRQIALSLRDHRLLRERINVVRRDIENLIELPIGFWKVTKTDI